MTDDVVIECAVCGGRLLRVSRGRGDEPVLLHDPDDPVRRAAARKGGSNPHEGIARENPGDGGSTAGRE